MFLLDNAVLGIKKLILTFAPSQEDRLLELHLTYNVDEPAESQLIEDYKTVLSSIQLHKV